MKDVVVSIFELPMNSNIYLLYQYFIKNHPARLKTKNIQQDLEN